jgi:hypothetical protein
VLSLGYFKNLELKNAKHTEKSRNMYNNKKESNKENASMMAAISTN